MTTLKLVTCDQHLVLQKQPVVASGDKNSVQVQIELCSMWDGFDVKVAFYKDGNRDFVLDVPLEDGACMVPPEMLDTPCVLNIGIWGKDARGRYKTSTMVKYRVLEGTPIEEGVRLVAVNDGTATEDQVLDGATFYAGDTAKKTGNIKTFEEGEPEYVLKGDPGESAYDIAVKNGFDGTEAEWLASLNGNDGKDGKDGVDGKDGYTPIKGVDYFDGRDGTNGKDGVDGYTPVKGVDYFDGKNGADGKDGKDGYTPVKGVDYFDGQDGKNGKDGVDGKDGYTPQKGVDYRDGVDGKDGAPGTTNYNELSNKPVIPSSVSEVAHQYAVSNSKDNISDVETWTKVTSSLSQRARSCIFANGYYVVCGTGGELAYSKDGVAWTKVTPFVSGTLTNITYGKGKYIVVDEFANLWMAEETPEMWSKIRNGEDWGAGVGSIIYANNQFVIAGDYMCAFSEDGYSWTQVDAPSTYNQVTFGNGRYVAVGAGGAVSVSFDGKVWYDRSNPAVTGDLRGVTYAKGRFIIGGIDGVIMYTEDFETWGIATSNSAGVRYVRQIVYAENRYYAACYTSSGAGEIWVSDDGETWAVQQQMNVRLWCLNYNDGRLITAGDSGAVYVLDLGIVWLTKQPELASGQYLWERIVFTLSDGGKVIGDSVCIKAAQTTENWTFTLDDGSTVTKVVCVG